jgi:alginate O-acetyltransferase complex protein AlgI
MVFSSPVFLFVFLPIVLILYYSLGKTLRNILLLLSSLFFYAWGEGYLVLIMVFSICVNYLGGRLIQHIRLNFQIRSGILFIAIGINLALLIYFKYLNFFVDNLKSIGLFRLTFFEHVSLPIGISFFTFQSISYLVDVYRKQSEAQTNPLNLGLYISLFPQLIAGPIVRYHDIANQINNRRESLLLFSSGVVRFIRGLAKKMIIANPMALIADEVFLVPPNELTTLSAWLGIICYSLQIYFDFSGYSDMAIGLGRMFGFKFLENFQWPYISRSIQEFWRRWHISLSSWFRDYLYIPLGGNRKTEWRTYTNLGIVFFITGFWHGASWSFIIWGLYHGFFLMIERLGFKRLLKRIPVAINHLYVLLVVMIGWVFFRAESLELGMIYLGRMFGIGNGTNNEVLFYFNNYLIFVLILGIVLSTKIRRLTAYTILIFCRKKLLIKKTNLLIANDLFMIVLNFILLIWSIVELAQNSYNPFIYFRF